MSREMKHSGIEWIGEIPKEWTLKRFQSQVIEIKEKNSPIKTNFILSLTINDGVIPYEDKGNVGNISKDNHEEYKLAYPDTIVLNSMNILIGAVGICKYYGCVSPVYYVFKNVESSDLRFLNYILSSPPFQKYLRKFANGILEIRLRISSSDIIKQSIPVPSLAEQQKIADYLDKVCGEVDELVTLQEQMIEELKAYKQSVITEAVTKGLNPNAPMKDSGVDWIGEIPEHWKVTKIKLIAKTNSGSTPKSISDGEDSNIIWIRTTDINDDNVIDSSLHLTKEEYASASCPMLDKGTCVVAMYGGGGTIGKCGFLDCRATINQALCSMEVSNLYYSRYLFCVLKAIRYYWMKFAVGTRKDPNINQEIVKNMIVTMPPLSEQQAIASYLDSKCSEIDALIAIKQQKIEELKEYKKSVIYEYVTGKKEVC